VKQAAKKIVVVDDTLPLRVMLEDLLVDAGYEVQTASDGVEGWEILSSQIKHIDLLVLDLLMPRMSGFDVLSKLKAEFPDRKFPVLVISGVFKSEKDIQRLKELGANGYLSKNAVVDEILYRVNTFFHDVTTKHRRHPRVLFNIPVEYQYNGTKHSSYTTNLCESGCFVRTLKPAPLGLKVSLILSIPDKPDPIATTGKVAWINKYDENRKSNTLPGMGIEFCDLEETHYRILKDFIAKKLKEDNLWASV
jgi:uncharacterized protein (TIGR02266 family)